MKSNTRGRNIAPAFVFIVVRTRTQPGAASITHEESDMSDELLVHEEIVGDFSARVYYDDDPDRESPRDGYELGHMVCFHNRHNLGDDHDFYGAADLVHYLRHTLSESEYVALPLFVFEHSGMTMNTVGFSCPWDSGQVGYIYVERAAILQNFGRKRITQKLRAKVEQVLRDEVETYAQYLRGEVYRTLVCRQKTDADGYFVADTDDWVSGSGGIYGFEYAKSCAREDAEHEAKFD